VWVEQTEAIASRKYIRTHTLKAAILIQKGHATLNTGMVISHPHMVKKTTIL
jgi:hypothetical protein